MEFPPLEGSFFKFPVASFHSRGVSENMSPSIEIQRGAPCFPDFSNRRFPPPPLSTSPFFQFISPCWWALQRLLEKAVFRKGHFPSFCSRSFFPPPLRNYDIREHFLSSDDLVISNLVPLTVTLLNSPPAYYSYDFCLSSVLLESFSLGHTSLLPETLFSPFLTQVDFFPDKLATFGGSGGIFFFFFSGTAGVGRGPTSDFFLDTFPRRSRFAVP